MTTIGILGTGDMGHAIGRVLGAGGARVITCLAGRGRLSAERASAAGIEAVLDDAALVSQADIFLSVLPPGEALGLARRITSAAGAAGRTLLYADCNAVSPGTAQAVGETIASSGSRFVDVGIIGGPPKPGVHGATTLYASGPHATEFGELRELGLDITVMNGPVGQASGLKMCYASLTKGLNAIGAELLVAAERLGLSAALRIEFESSQPDLLRWVTRGVPGTPHKAYRWVAEMQEIAATFAEVGLTPRIFEGAAELYDAMSRTPAAQEATQAGHPTRELPALLEALAATMRSEDPAGALSAAARP